MLWFMRHNQPRSTKRIPALASTPFRGWVLYDGHCGLCRAAARRFGRIVTSRGFTIQPLQRKWVEERLRLPPEDLLTQMRVLTPDGAIFGGADALLHLARLIWWAWPVRVLAKLPGGMRLLRGAYRLVASHRSCSTTACARSPRDRVWATWLPLPALIVTAILLGPIVPAWVLMWALAGAIYLGCKWLTWRRAGEVRKKAPRWKSLGYLLAWPGMDAREFLSKAPSRRPAPVEWITAVGKIALGAIIIWCACRLLPQSKVLLVGWIGMVGLFTMLHAGLFHLLSLVWRRAGVNATPLFDWPAGARSLGDFWGRRWNVAFRTLARDSVFAPLSPRIGPRAALMAAFIASGLIHDLVISFPARAGYGLPTAYFTLQGMGLLLERSNAGMRLGLKHGARGWLFVLAIAGLPAFALFHPPFIRSVFVPFLRALGAI